MIFKFNASHKKRRGCIPVDAATPTMIYGINEIPPFKKLLLSSFQLLLAIFVATALIAKLCNVNMGAALVGAGIGTLIYTFVTKGQSPMFISNSGAFVTPVILALTAAGYTGVAIGGLTSFIVYVLFGLAFTKISVEKIYNVFPPALIGAITVVIGINLMGFIPAYLGETGQIGIILALFTMLVTTLVAHYGKGLLRILPFLIGIIAGYLAAAIVTFTGIAPILDFTTFSNMSLFSLPEFAFTKWEVVHPSQLLSIVIVYIAFTVSAMMECLSDHAALGGIIGTDLYKTPGLGRIFIGEGCSNLASAFIGGLGACSYGEGVACVGFSKVASVWVTRTAAIMLILLGFFGPIQAFIASIPACVFAGSAIVLYGFISCSGVKMLQKVDLNEQKNLILVSVVLSLGISGVMIGGTTISLSGTALALVVGVILHAILREKEN